MFERELGTSNLFLHSATLTFLHPFTQVEVEIKASLPLPWRTVIHRFDWEFD